MRIQSLTVPVADDEIGEPAEIPEGEIARVLEAEGAVEDEETDDADRRRPLARPDAVPVERRRSEERTRKTTTRKPGALTSSFPGSGRMRMTTSPAV